MKTGTPIADLLLHKDPYFGQWSMDRHCGMSLEFKRAVRRAKWFHSHEKTKADLITKGANETT